jgi:hypothetical protein
MKCKASECLLLVQGRLEAIMNSHCDFVHTCLPSHPLFIISLIHTNNCIIAVTYLCPSPHQNPIAIPQRLQKTLTTPRSLIPLHSTLSPKNPILIPPNCNPVPLQIPCKIPFTPLRSLLSRFRPLDKLPALPSHMVV